jgi:hypothetical protein
MENKTSNSGEEDIDPAEIDAAGERLSNIPAAPEVPPKLEQLTEWDQPVDATGEAAPKIIPEDENTVAEELVDEGVEEADRDQRLASADPDFEP